MDERLSLAEAELQLAAENLTAARLVAAGGLYRNAIGDLYYAAYHAVVAVLAAHGIATASHEGVQTMFGLHFIKPGAIDRHAGKYLGNLHHARLTADYKGFVPVEADDHAEARAQACFVVQVCVDYLAGQFPGLPVGAVRQVLVDMA